tara:strand:- start:526 stop:732 length:207 start_codon:yes stop_codon:yes gene_type:complete
MLITGKDNIALHRMITLKHALKLEIAGLKRNGRSVYAIVKEEFNLKGSKQKVLDQFSSLITKNAIKEK